MKKIAILVFFTVGFFVHVWACTGLIAGSRLLSMVVYWLLIRQTLILCTEL